MIIITHVELRLKSQSLFKVSEVSSSRKLRPPNFRPRKLRPVDKTIDILNTVLREYLFMIMIVTTPKCQIMQRSHIDN